MQHLCTDPRSTPGTWQTFFKGSTSEKIPKNTRPRNDKLPHAKGAASRCSRWHADTDTWRRPWARITLSAAYASCVIKINCAVGASGERVALVTCLLGRLASLYVNRGRRLWKPCTAPLSPSQAFVSALIELTFFPFFFLHIHT